MMAILKCKPITFALISVVVIAYFSLFNVYVRDLRIRRSNEYDVQVKRSLSIELPNGDCEWTPPHHANQDPNFELFSSLLTAYPGSVKRYALIHMEGLTELKVGDDFNLSGEHINTRYAFYKTQYPHHEGVWSWSNKAKQVVYLIQNPRTAMISYQHLLHEINYANEWQTAYENVFRVYTVRPPVSSWLDWRNLRFHAEIHWWSWHLEYWMENGLLRDIYTHDLTTTRHFARLKTPQVYTEAELREFQAALTNVQPEYDEHCGIGSDMNDCLPVAIASHEKMIDETTGPEEVAKITAVVENKPGIDIIGPNARECIWRKLIVDKIAVRDPRDREGPALDGYKFTKDQIEALISELERLVNKFSSPDWVSIAIAQEVVMYLEEYISENQAFLAAMD